MKLYTFFLLLIITVTCLAQESKSDSMQRTEDSTKVAIDVNNLFLPIDNAGVLGDVSFGDPPIAGGRYDDEVILFSGGFYLSGYNNG